MLDDRVYHLPDHMSTPSTPPTRVLLANDGDESVAVCFHPKDIIYEHYKTVLADNDIYDRDDFCSYYISISRHDTMLHCNQMRFENLINEFCREICNHTSHIYARKIQRAFKIFRTRWRARLMMTLSSLDFPIEPFTSTFHAQ